MIGRDEILRLVPHAGRMCLIEAVDAWDAAAIDCRGAGAGPGHPLQRAAGLSSLHLVEYGAQAMAVHGGLSARAEGRAPPPGMLATARDVELAVERLDGLPSPLRIHARRLAGDARGWSYAFEAFASERWLGRGRLTVIFG